MTVDGKRSAQFEQTFLVTETGVEVLTGEIQKISEPLDETVGAAPSESKLDPEDANGHD